LAGTGIGNGGLNVGGRRRADGGWEFKLKNIHVLTGAAGALDSLAEVGNFSIEGDENIGLVSGSIDGVAQVNGNPPGIIWV
jgi:hypothetical protein